MRSKVGLSAALGYALLYAVSVAVCLKSGSVGEDDLIGLVVVLGIGFCGLAWLTTRFARPLALPPLRNPRGELALALVLTALIALWLVVGGHALDWLPVSSARGKYSLTLVKKLLFFVAIPFAVFRYRHGHGLAAYGLSRQALGALWGRQGLAALAVSVAICGFQFFAGSAAAPLRQGEITGTALWAGLPLCFLWLALEAGLVEEFFFRGILQTRLSTWFNSDLAGVIAMAVLFGLAHAPGYFLRGSGGVEGVGAHPSALGALAYSIAVVSVAGLYLGVFYARTKNLYAVILVHASTDLFPNLSEFVKAWGL